jgi:MFS superfamily sulfate permease-like transporter
MFALIGSIESLLTVKAVDAIDPCKRKSDLNKDLLGVGIGNFILSLIGGLPMISEVVRSYSNVTYGAKTRWSNFMHGAFLLVFALALADLIHLVPVSALAGVLCVTGYRLAAPRHFRECREIGFEQLVVFIATIVATLLTDLLVGVFIGVVVQALCSLLMGASVKSLVAVVKPGQRVSDSLTVLHLPSACSFFNIISFKGALEAVDTNDLELDFSESVLVDHTFMHEIRGLEREFAEQGRKVILKNLERLAPVSSHHAACRRLLSHPYPQQALAKS